MVSLLVNLLPDNTLLQIFRNLDPFHRLLASEVCRHWHDLLLLPWSDVRTFDLTSAPPERIVPILTRCGNVKRLIAKDLGLPRCLIQRAFDVVGKQLSSVCIYNAKQAVCSDTFYREFDDGTFEAHPYVYSAQNDRLEYVWHNDLVDRAPLMQTCIPPENSSIRHLQISGSTFCIVWVYLADALANLPHLETLLLANRLELRGSVCKQGFVDAFGKLKALKEICLAFEYSWGDGEESEPQFNIADAVAETAAHHWPKLEVIWLTKLDVNLTTIRFLIACLKSLKIIVLSNCSFGTGADPTADECVSYSGRDQVPLRFYCSCEEREDSCVRAAISVSYRSVIMLRMPNTAEQFLSLPDSAIVFENVWVAQKIMEACRYGCHVVDATAHCTSAEKAIRGPPASTSTSTRCVLQ